METLIDAIRYFSDPQVCIDTVAAMRWPEGKPVCPKCGSLSHYYLKTQSRWKCKACSKQFSVKVGTIFEDSPVSLDKWLVTLWMITNCKNGVSSYEIAKSVGVTQKSAWFMLHRLRVALKDDPKGTMGGNWQNPIEVDETYIGGKARNKHLSQRKQMEKKAIVMGMLNRETREIRAKVIPHARRDVLQGEILKNVGFNAHVFTDGHVGYDGLDKYNNFTHKTVNHINQYVNGRVHTQGIENFWALLKRSLSGTYVAVEPFHLDSYIDEQVFRFNNNGRKMNDKARFKKALSQIAGKRLTLAELTGKVGETAF
jgi:transposase-like protein